MDSITRIVSVAIVAELVNYRKIEYETVGNR